jgi:hypothetical protein
METKESQLNMEIMELTTLIKAKHPEVYSHLNEMPVTIPNVVMPHVKIKQLQEYVQSLKAIINTHITK